MSVSVLGVSVLILMGVFYLQARSERHRLLSRNRLVDPVPVVFVSEASTNR
jgi:hypothetical protein